MDDTSECAGNNSLFQSSRPKVEVQPDGRVCGDVTFRGPYKSRDVVRVTFHDGSNYFSCPGRDRELRSGCLDALSMMYWVDRFRPINQRFISVEYSLRDGIRFVPLNIVELERTFHAVADHTWDQTLDISWWDDFEPWYENWSWHPYRPDDDVVASVLLPYMEGIGTDWLRGGTGTMDWIRGAMDDAWLLIEKRLTEPLVNTGESR